MAVFAGNKCHKTGIFVPANGKVTVTFEVTVNNLEDGTKISCVIADIKSQEVVPWDTNLANEWGHNNDKNIIEFEVFNDAFYNTYNQSNHGANGWYNEWGGKRVVGATYLEENIIK